MSKLLLNLAICFAVTLSFFRFTYAQHVAMISDEVRIELSLDLIRKGIQQEDTLKTLSVFSNQFVIKEKSVVNKNVLTQKLKSIFNKSSQRNLVLKRSTISKSASGNSPSNLWDFDILNHQIEFRDDSAYVNCDLVLWGADANSSLHNGAIIKEQFVFYSPQIEKIVPESEGYNEWGSIEPRRLQKPLKTGWVLVKCDNFFDFLENYGDISVKQDSSSGVEK